MQLVSDRVRMFDSLKNRFIGTKEVKEKFGVFPEKVVDVQALAERLAWLEQEIRDLRDL